MTTFFCQLVVLSPPQRRRRAQNIYKAVHFAIFYNFKFLIKLDYLARAIKVLRKDAKNYTNVKIHIGIFIFTDLSTNRSTSLKTKKVA